MGLFNKKEKQKVYCQYCSADLTEIGGKVSNEGAIYCGGLLLSNFDCGKLAQKALKRDFTFEDVDSKKVQQLIEKGKLTKFSLLERTVSK